MLRAPCQNHCVVELYVAPITGNGSGPSLTTNSPGLSGLGKPTWEQIQTAANAEQPTQLQTLYFPHHSKGLQGTA